MPHYTAEYKHKVCSKYKPNDPAHSFAKLATTYDIAGGKGTLQRWYKQWDGSATSLERKAGSGRPCALTEHEKKIQILNFVRRNNSKGVQVDWETVHENVVTKTGKAISLHTVKTYGHEELKITSKRTYEMLTREGWLKSFVPVLLHLSICDRKNIAKKFCGLRLHRNA